MLYIPKGQSLTNNTSAIVVDGLIAPPIEVRRTDALPDSHSQLETGKPFSTPPSQKGIRILALSRKTRQSKSIAPQPTDSLFPSFDHDPSCFTISYSPRCCNPRGCSSSNVDRTKNPQGQGQVGRI
jgi:hypothetical protein